MIDRKLTPKQQAFADYYIESGNASESAVRAGYSESTARFIGAENLTKPNIKTYIDEQLQKLSDKRIMGAQEALELLTSIARGEITEEVVIPTEIGYERVDKMPDIRDRQRAAEQLLRRYALNDNDKLKNKMLEAQIKKVEAETKNEVEGTKKITIVDSWTDNDAD